MSEALHLTLVNNDPTATLLVTPDGDPLYSIATPSHHESPPKQVALEFDPRRTPSTTTINRLERYHSSIGHVETSIGIVEYQGEDSGTHVLLCVGNTELVVAPHNHDFATKGKPLVSDVHHVEDKGLEEEAEDKDEEEAIPLDNSWEFTGPDNKHYKWQMFIQSPILILAGTSLIPLARYRRAKLGIVSRPRRAFLEIFPAGVGIIDFIVVTFVAFMKQRFLIEPREDFVAKLGDAPVPEVFTRSVKTKCALGSSG